MHISFYYVRHGETRFNVLDRVQGVCDSPLTERGISQAQATAERLRDVPLTRAFSSSSERASDTAEIILEGRGIGLTRLKGLRELDFGDFEGYRMNAGGSDDAKLEACWAARDYSSVGGESREQMVARIRSTYEQIARQCADGDSVLTVSHRGYFFYLLEALFGFTLEEQEERWEDPMAMVPNASVARFSYDDGAWTLEALPS